MLRYIDHQVEFFEMSDQLLRLPQVLALTGLSKTTCYSLIGRKEFPRPKQISSRTVAWPLSSVQAWIESRKNTQAR